MKELEKTKRISVAAVLTILIVVIALLSYKRPKHNYNVESQTILNKVLSTEYFIEQQDIDKEKSVLVDIRSINEFERGHMDEAINLYAPELLADENISLIKDILSDGKSIVLYGTNPEEAILSYMVLYQLGYENLKVLPVQLSYNQTELIVKSVEIEKSNADIDAFIKESIKKAQAKPKPKKIVVPPKKIIPKKKKKKMPIEGGC